MTVWITKNYGKFHFSPHHLWQIDGEKTETVTDLFSWAPKSLWTVIATMPQNVTIFGDRAFTGVHVSGP